MGYFFHFSRFLNWIGNLGVKSRLIYCLRFQFLLDVQANLPETAHLLSSQMAVLSSFLQVFIVLGIYNFEQGIVRLELMGL